uniref:Uncharacterized protein n=1 Tax=Fusarium oxysporum (strain Fo5176) TaxID=660025 RepID=A0A0C4BL37_FUSOF
MQGLHQQGCPMPLPGCKLGPKAEREVQGILRRLREGADVATTMRQVKDGDLPLQPAWAPGTRLHYEFPYSTSMPAALLSPDNPYLGSTVFEITSHALPQSAEQTEAWASQPETIYMTPYNIAELMDPYIPNIQISRWTSVETDDELLRALLRAYFLYDYANYTCFQKDIFLQAMRDSDTRFCSPLLVNAVLAEACHSYRKATHRAQYWRPETLGYRFLAEAKRLWALESARSLPSSELDRLQKVLDDWYIALPEPIKSHKAVLPCQLIMHFEHGDTYLTYFLSILANTTIENMNRDSVSPDDTETLKILRATLLLAVKGLYDQGQHVYVSSAMCRLIRDRMTKEDMDALRRHTTWKDDQPLVPQYVRSTFPVTIVMLEEDWQMETVENLAKKYDQLALEANEGESSMVITPDGKSEQTG